MAVPGISFQIVSDSPPVLGVRSDRTALIALTQRGPEETPTLVHSYDEFVEVFGCAMDGALGAIAAKGYFDNGGAELIVTRFVPRLALAAKAPIPPASGALMTAGVSGAPFALPFVASELGSFGDKLEIQALLTLRRRVKGSLDSILTAADAGAPAHVSTPAIDDWGRITGSFPTFHYTSGSALIVPDNIPLMLEIYEPTFALRILSPGRPDVIVTGLDLRDPKGMKERLKGSPVTIGALPSIANPELPRPHERVRLQGGSDGLYDTSPAEVGELAASFRACIKALELTDAPDIVVAPDLWSRIYRTKGKTLLAFDAATAKALSNALVASAAKMRDRVVLVDPPLLGKGEVRPAAPSELVSHCDDLRLTLAEDRDFSAMFTPWLRIVAGGRYRGDDTLLVPPSAHVAGRMAKTARARGAWIATGNVPIEGVVGLSDRLSLADQESIYALGVSPLRVELPAGATIQGVRSLAWPDRSAWGFLSTRRLFNYLRRALRPLGMSYTFEPNAPATWAAIRRDVTRLLRDMFARGAFAGADPSEAFFVKVDDSLNPEEARDAGALTVQIGVAPAAPLEFLLVRLIVEGGVARVAEGGA